MPYGYIDFNKLLMDELKVFEALGVSVTLCCPWSAPTRWERIKDNALTFIGWR